MDADELLLCTAATSTIILYANVINKRKRKKVTWAKGWIGRRLHSRGVLNMLNKELLLEDAGAYRNFLRMSVDSFEILLQIMEEKLKRQDTVMRESISVRNR
ncbi:hypothetical protein QE152_g40549 [Popillia japonica]|uniref:Uncharacterized protein n=1 Tax=Popillia japonica TaxID=7064 RepID=A0AAW1HFT5_POPJA